MIEGYYYLHTNGSLIYKRELGETAADLRESDFVRMFWPLDVNNRSHAWRILIEASALNATASRVAELSILWKCDDEDAACYAQSAGVKLSKDGDHWCATKEDFIDLEQSRAGFGPTCLAAMAELCGALGFKAGKMWGADFHNLLECKS